MFTIGPASYNNMFTCNCLFFAHLLLYTLIPLDCTIVKFFHIPDSVNAKGPALLYLLFHCHFALGVIGGSS